MSWQGSLVGLTVAVGMLNLLSVFLESHMSCAYLLRLGTTCMCSFGTLWGAKDAFHVVSRENYIPQLLVVNSNP
eukprot:3158215-Amphidinium_carterae.2